LDFPSTADKIIPLVMIAHPIEVWYEFEAAQENIIAEVIRKPISTTLGLFRTNVTLKGNFRVARNIARQKMNGHKMLRSTSDQLTNGLGTCKEVSQDLLRGE
jgi:hypothetical protein